VGRGEMSTFFLNEYPTVCTATEISGDLLLPSYVASKCNK